MRIAIDARYATDHFPGIGRYIYNLIVALAQLDQPHTFLVLHNPALPNSRYDIAALARFGSVELVATGARPFSTGEQLGIPRLLRRVRADLYHAPYYVRPYAGLACPSVVTLYDIIPRLFPAEASPRARLLFGLLMRLAMRASQGAIAISESARNDLIAAYRFPPERIAVTPLAADPRFRPQSAEAVAAVRTNHGLPERYILTLASNKPHKNLPRLVEAFSRLQIPGPRNLQSPISNLQLAIAGHWDPRYPEARTLAERLGVADRIHWLPGVDDVDLPALLSGAEVFVFPSLYEGFGLPPLEAMACGAAVLCGDVSSLPEVVGDAALRVDTRDTAALAGGLARLLEDGELRARLRQSGIGRAASFSWHNTAAATLDVYASLMQQI
jgi:alpha-1,3-rhamnosyl/mannosyltransferase